MVSSCEHFVEFRKFWSELEEEKQPEAKKLFLPEFLFPPYKAPDKVCP